MKRLLKNVVQHAVAAAAPSLWKLRSESLVILMYHRVLPVGHLDRDVEQPGMYVSPETLAMHIEILQRHFSLVHLDDWVDAVRRGERVEGRACAITFDDGWRDNYEFAFPVLQRARAPATIFLVSDMIGSSYSFWSNRLARVLSEPLTNELRMQMPDWLRAAIESTTPQRQIALGLRRDEIDRLITLCKEGRTDADMLAALDSLPSSTGAGRDLMNWDEIRQMARSGLIRFGSHTRRHTRLLPHVPTATMADEIEGSSQVLSAALNARTTSFCYPNGDFCSAAVDIVRRCYRSAVTTRTGWNTAASDLFLLARMGMHEDVSRTRAAFLSRLAGVG